MLIFKKKKTCYHVKNNDLIKIFWKVIKIGCQGDEIDNHLEKKKKNLLSIQKKKIVKIS